MIKYNKKNETGELICDDCGIKEELPARDIPELISNARALDWKIIKTGMGYEHYCKKHAD